MRKHLDIVFEILHYLAYEATVLSVRYIQEKIDTESYHIVITDNASPDGTGKKLIEKYKDDEHITVIQNTANEGFTRGNNFGIKYIRDNYEFDFMVVMNNDVMLEETRLVSKLRYYKEKYDFSVAGPDIIDKYGVSSNPIADRLPDRAFMYKRLLGEKKKQKWDSVGLLVPYRYFLEMIETLKKLLGRDRPREYRVDPCTGCVLHGSLWIFSDIYFMHYEGLADKKYMYMEEETLQLMIQHKGLVSLYIPDIIVLHLHGMATRQIHKKKSEMIRAKIFYDTIKEYLELYDSLEERKGK